MERGMLRLCFAAVIVMASCVLQAQTWPTRPIRLVVPFGAGSPPDIVSRLIADRYVTILGQAVAVENRAGASGTIGLADVMRQPADGYTFLALPSTLASIISLYKEVRTDLRKDLEPVGQIDWSYNVLVVSPNSSVRTVAELIALIKSQQGKLSYASGGTGTPAHLIAAQMLLATGTVAQHIPYNQFPQAVADVIADRVQFMIMGAPVAVPQVTAGKLRGLAVTRPGRMPVLKDVPSFAEAGQPDLMRRAWTGIVVKSGTPQEIVARMSQGLGRIMALPEVRERIASLQSEPADPDPKLFRELVRSDMEVGERVIREAGIKLE
jgi:tripartite-type tricarboxylate transporter receptor subunit TctC